MAFFVWIPSQFHEGVCYPEYWSTAHNKGLQETKKYSERRKVDPIAKFEVPDDIWPKFSLDQLAEVFPAPKGWKDHPPKPLLPEGTNAAGFSPAAQGLGDGPKSGGSDASA